MTDKPDLDAIEARAKAAKGPYIVPDGAHHSGLMKDYGGVYSPEHQAWDFSPDEALALTAALRAAWEEIERLREEVESRRAWHNRQQDAFSEAVEKAERGEFETGGPGKYKVGSP